MKIGIDIFGGDHGRSGIGAYFISILNNFPEEISHNIIESFYLCICL